MGNVFKALRDSGQTLRRRRSFKSSKRDSEEEHDNVELWSWLQSANACSPAKIMPSCYHDKGVMLMLNADLKRMGRDDWGWQRHQCKDPPGLRPAPKPDPDFVKIQRRKLISRIQWLDMVLDTLQGDGILSASNRDAINIYALQKEKNRVLVDLVLSKGEKAQEAFYGALRQSDPFLLQELENGPIREENSSVTSVLTEMLEFLVSDELRTFQWLVSDHMTWEGCPINVGEQLQRADRPTTQRLLREHVQTKQTMSVALQILLNIVPTLRVCFGGEAVTSQRSCDIRVVVNVDTTVVQITPEVFEDGNMFRLRCQQGNVFRCSLTDLQLEGVGDLVYQMIPWDMDFLSSKGLRPAGPLFRFTVLTGRFYRLHLPHCQLVSAGDQHFLSVVHATRDSVEFITPDRVTEGHVIIDVPSFSCFGLARPAASGGPIDALVLLFREPTEHSLFVLLLPRNVCLAQVINQWKRRIRAQYLETVPACVLIPNQTYILSGQPVALIQPESSKFVNFGDYNNFLPSFQVWPTADVQVVELQLKCHVTRLRLIGWLVGSTESVVWHQVVMLRAAASIQSSEESEGVTLVLLRVLDCLRSEDLKFFQHLLSLQSDPIPISRLEAADRTRTVDLMVQRYHGEGARQVTKEILRTMEFQQLANQLE